ncbi:DUF3560 domain-containing protein [Chryseobacterium sp.]|uniref:DUF3560 domain-containing protein n=1 Tax=Chryseobacterium sp. TaxID=1871047 RepID=UPI00333F6C41
MKHNFEERKQNRIDYAEKQAQKNEQKSDSLYDLSNKMASYIPLGQPILVGHHSEKSDRNYRQKIDNTFSKSIEAGKKASYYKDKARTIENNQTIFSDDPLAVEKIEAKIEHLERLHNFMKSANTCIKKQDKEGFMKLEYATDRLWEQLNEPDSFGNLGFAPYKLTNSSANLRRLKKRSNELQKVATLHTEIEEIKGVRVVKNVEANRIQLFFPEKPSAQVIKDLSKGYSFRWCRSEGAWQRHLNNAGIRAAKQFLGNYQQE